VTAGIDVSTGGDSVTLNAAVTGTNSFTLTAADTTALNISGAGDLTLATALPQAAAVITSTSTGDVTMTTLVGQAYTGGAGVDTITTAAGLQTAAVNGGAGVADRLNVTNDANVATTGAAKYSGFEVLSVATGQTVDASTLTNSSITSVVTNGNSVINGLSAAQAANVVVDAGGAFTLGLTGASTPGNIDIVNLDVQHATSLGTIVLANVEKLNVTASKDATIGLLTSVAALTGMVIDGAGDVDITTGALAANANTTIDASAVTGTFDWDGALSTANGMSITGSATGVNTIDTSTAAVTNVVTGGSASDTITGGAGSDTISAGEGNNTVVTGNGVNTVTAGDGHNSITGGTGVDTVTVGNGYNTIDTGAGADVIVAGTGGNIVNAGADADTITFGVNVAGVSNVITSDDGDSGIYNAASTLVSSTTLLDVYTGLSAGDTIDLAASLNTEASYDGFTTATAGAALTNVVTALTIGQFIGTYDATAATFTSDATGDDLMLSYNNANGTTADESIVLVGMTNVLADTEMTNGFITIA
jgi:hypothetical protein